MPSGYVATKIKRDRDPLRILRELAARRLLLTQARAADRCSLLELVPRLSPKRVQPTWLAPYATFLERPFDDANRTEIVFAAPPQHGKTWLTLHGLIRIFQLYPGREHAYVTYNQIRADEVSTQLSMLGEAAGLNPRGPKYRLEFDGGSAIKVIGMDCSLTGAPISGILVIDDPVKDRQDADSALQRDRQWNWWTDVADVRVHPGGAVVVMATRWHTDDLSGRLIKAGWRYINLKAVADEDDPLGREPGTALWPDGRPIEWLRPKMLNAYTWASLYQGEPRPKGGTVFEGAHWYDPGELPRDGYTQAHGIDLAYTAKSHADYSVCWTMRRVGDVYYVVDVKRGQTAAPEFAEVLRGQAARFPGILRWYGSTTEVGTGHLLGHLGGMRLNPMLARGDKFLRAQPLAAAWNAGKIRLPSGGADKAPEWTNDVIGEFGDFTGVNDRHDDLIDAAAACFDELQLPDAGPPLPKVHTYNSPLNF